MSPRVYSMSGVSTFKRCAKKYQIQYELLLDGLRESQALITGSNFHSIMEQYAKTGKIVDDVDYDMAVVAKTYIDHIGFPKNIVSVEKSIYVKMLPDVYVRCTMDLVYLDNGVYVIRDWKTFGKMPSLDSDLDFQARVYIALAMKHFGTEKVRFEHEYIRTTPPNIPKDKAGNEWSVDECYVNAPLSISMAEARQIVRELQYDLKTLESAKSDNMFTRSPQKGGGYDQCASCSVKEICKADLAMDGIENVDLEYISSKRQAVEIPDDLN
jgi:hypothetical protein